MISKTWRDDPRVTEDNFIISIIDAEFLKKYEINLTVDKFKEIVRDCPKYFTVETGNELKAVQHTKVYDIKDFKKGEKIIDYTKFYEIHIRTEQKTENLQKFEKFLNFLENLNFLQILSISQEYPNRNSVFARKYYRLSVFEEVQNEIEED